MKKLVLLLLVVAGVFIFISRNRMYLRDPLGSVTRNGVQEDGAQVFLNARNEVLIENDTPPLRVTLVQQRVPQVAGTPAQLKCVHWVVCLADADTATLAGEEAVTLVRHDGKAMEYRDAAGTDVVVSLR